MKIGLAGVFQNWHADLSDEQMYVREVELLERSEDLGFNSVMMPEHHFDDYSMCPDNVLGMGYMAGRTRKLQLNIGAVILPWNHPLRVVEKVIMLDHLSRGRVLLGFGRGLARMEYAGFGIDMNESRERFDEAAEMIMRGLETGIVEGSGRFYPQPRIEVRPRPARSFRDRIFSIAMSPDSVDVAARLGVVMATFLPQDIEKVAPEVLRYRRLFRDHHRREAPPVMIIDWMYCHEDYETALKVGQQYIAQYFLSLCKHYEFAGTHFDTTRGYQAYAEGARLIREFGKEAAAQAFVDAQAWGDPARILAKYQRTRELIGDFDLMVAHSYAGMPYPMVEASVDLFARQVMPELHRMMEMPLAVAA